MTKFPALLVMLATLALPGLAAAADPAIPDDKMAPYRTALHGDLRQFYAERLMLSQDEAEDFWPVYNDYVADQKELDDRLFMLLQKYAGLYKQGSLSDRKAKPLFKEMRDIEQEDWKLHDKFMQKAAKELPPFKATLFYQLDNRVRTAARYERALQVPLIN
jgi:hypothetical protein